MNNSRKQTGKNRLGWNILWIVMLILILLISGCGSSPVITPSTPKAKENQKIITDSFGRKVVIPKAVHKIGCLYSFTGYAVTMLGQGEKIVAVVEGLKRDVLLNKINSQIKSALVPNTSGIINIEELLNAKPDLVFVSSETANNKGEVAKLNEAGIPYIVITFNTIKQQENAISIIGKAIGAEQKAQDFNDYYEASIALIQNKLKALPAQKRLKVFHSVNEAARTDPANSLPTDWLEAAGAVNVSANHDHSLRLIDGTKYFASLEQIILWNPDVILANEPGVADYIYGNSQWAAINAVKNGRVYQMPIGISRWGHPGSIETPLAIQWTAKLLYPELFPDLDINEEAKKFYQEFFNYTPSSEEMDHILSGKDMRLKKS